MTIVDPSDRASAATWGAFVAMCVGMFMAILDIQIVASSLPDIQSGLGIAMDRLSWVQTAYLIAEVVAIPLTGWFTRLLSLRGLFVAAVAGFVLASAGCAASIGFASLIVFRIFQGFCAGAIIPTVFTTVFLLFPREAQVKATAIAGTFAVLAPTLGPTIGGYITETASWHWLFLINFVPGIAVAIATAFLLPRHPADWRLLRGFDWPTLLSLTVFLASLELVLKEGPARGWNDGVALGLLALCIASGVATVVASVRRVDPMVDLRLFRDRAFAVGSVYSFVLGFGLYCSVYLLPLFLAFVRQHTALEIGLIMLVGGAAQLLVAPVAAPLERRVDRRLLTATGYALFAAGLIANGFATYETDVDGLFWPQVLRGAGVMLCLLPTTSLALEAQPAPRLAEASGLFNLMRNLGGAVGIALVDTVIQLRPPVHVVRLAERLQAGDPTAALQVGIAAERFQNRPMGPVDEATRALLEPLVERAAAVASFNEAWLLTGVLFALSLALLPWLRPRR